jgi:hypothetical protein
MKIADLLTSRKPVMLYVSGDACHFTGGHHSAPVTIIDADEHGVLIEAAEPHATTGLTFYSWRHVIAITPAVEDAADDDYVAVNPGARTPKDPNRR